MRRLALTGALAVTAALLLAPAAGAATITVTNTTDDQLADPDDTDCALREAIEAANTNAAVDQCTAGQAGPNVDTIAIGDIAPAGPDAFEIVGSLLVAAPSGPVVIDGQGPASTTIEANETGRVFQIQNAGTVTMRDLRVTGGTAINSDGGGIQANFASLTLDNLLVEGNSVDGSSSLGLNGAGLATGNNSSSTITILNSNFNDNVIDSTGSVAGTTNRGAAIYLGTFATASIDRSTISGNSISGIASQTLRGAGISTLDAQGDLTITNSTIDNNFMVNGGTQQGAGVDWDESGNNDSLSVENVTFSANTVGASQNGGHIYANGPAVIAHTTFGPTTPTTMNGAGLYDAGGVQQVRNSLFETNTQDDCGGGDPVSLGHNVEKGPEDDCHFPAMGTDVLTDNPLLNPLADYGGPTRTHEISPSSIFLFDSIPPASCLGADGNPLTQDQRGAPRPSPSSGTSATACEPGAFEFIRCAGQQTYIVGTQFADTITGTASFDGILGLGGDDRIDPGDGTDRVCGGEGNDTLIEDDGDGSDGLLGEGGSDTLEFGFFVDGGTIDLATEDVSGPGIDTFIDSIENATGSPDPDTLIGDAGPNVLDGSFDPDMITGGGGPDTLLGDIGNDNLFSRDGVADVVDCGPGTGDTAQTDRLSLDSVTNCEAVDALPELPALTPTTPAAAPAPAKKKCKKKKRKKRSASAAAKCKKKKKKR